MWLKIKEGETINATIDFSSIKSIAKHWTGQRSELCLGEGCPHCLNRIPKRWRYQARLFIARAAVSWEFGEQAMIEINNISHPDNLAHITITRLGEGRTTRYQILPQSEAKQEEAKPYDSRAALLASDFLRRKYGHIYKEEGQGLPHQEL